MLLKYSRFCIIYLTQISYLNLTWSRRTLKNSELLEIFFKNQLLKGFFNYCCFLKQDFLVWMLGVCWDAFYLDASYSRKHLSLQFAKDILSIFVHNQQQSQSASSGGGVLFHLDGVKTHIVQWIVSEDSAEKTEDGFVNCRLKRLMGMFHDSVQINKVRYSIFTMMIFSSMIGRLDVRIIILC